MNFNLFIAHLNAQNFRYMLSRVYTFDCIPYKPDIFRRNFEFFSVFTTGNVTPTHNVAECDIMRLGSNA